MIGQVCGLFPVNLSSEVESRMIRLEYHNAGKAFLVAILIWHFHLKSLEIVMPKYLQIEISANCSFYCYRVGLSAASQYACERIFHD